LNLFYHMDKRKHFYLEHSSELIELISREYKIRENGETYIHKGDANEYINQINQFVPVCRDLGVENISYTSSSLKEFVVQCNKRLNASGSSYVVKAPRPTFESTIIFGASRPNFKVGLGDYTIPFRKTRNFTFGYTGKII